MVNSWWIFLCEPHCIKRCTNPIQAWIETKISPFGNKETLVSLLLGSTSVDNLYRTDLAPVVSKPPEGLRSYGAWTFEPL
jgi:hypothetical protein